MNEEIRNNAEIKEEELDSVAGGAILIDPNNRGTRFAALTLENRGNEILEATTLPNIVIDGEMAFTTLEMREVTPKPLSKKYRV